MPTQGSDWSSGLAFAETVISAPRKRYGKDLASKCMGRKPEHLALPKGAHSLESIALRNLLCNLSSLDELSLTTVPVAMVEQIWTAVCRSQLDSVNVWRIFAASPIGTKSFIKATGSSLKGSRMESLTTVARSPSLIWLTNLVISVDGLDPTSLTQIANINTLRRLHIVQMTSPRRARPVFDDRIFRSWADSAKASGSLSKLSMLFVYQCSDFTNHSLEVLRSFPALEELCTYGCGMVAPDKGRMRKHGWRYGEQ